MTRYIRYGLRLLGLGLALAVVALPVALGASDAPAPAALRFSLIPKKDVDQQLAELRPLLALVENRLGRPIQVIRPSSYQSVIEGLLSHSIDFAILGPASYAFAKARDPGIDAFASFAQRGGAFTPRGSYYYSILFVRQDSGCTDVKSLQGKTIAFTDPASTSGSLIPSVEFAQEVGHPVEDYFGPRVYTGSHDRSVQAVMDGGVDAGFVASSRLDEAVRKGVVRPEQVVVLWRSRPIHYDPFVFGGHVDEALRRQIREALLTPSPELTAMYAGMQEAGIVAVTDADYRVMHDLAARRK